ncbi:MAG TPA: CrcB family protein [Ilumatobacteraceae bacterium]|nr:CrcB family protein [Ilumatobacteraceae bacterium]
MQVFDRSTPLAPHALGAVALGGAIGSAARWAVAIGVESSASNDTGWPWATLIVNVVGCLLIGFAARHIVRDTTMWAFTVTGILGGFTTFSALAVELNDLADADRLPLAALYAVVTMVAGIGATAIAGSARAPETSS